MYIYIYYIYKYYIYKYICTRVCAHGRVYAHEHGMHARRIRALWQDD